VKFVVLTLLHCLRSVWRPHCPGKGDREQEFGLQGEVRVSFSLANLIVCALVE